MIQHSLSHHLVLARACVRCRKAVAAFTFTVSKLIHSPLEGRRREGSRESRAMRTQAVVVHAALTPSPRPNHGQNSKRSSPLVSPPYKIPSPTHVWRRGKRDCT
eukprot:scaffold19481_cov112-Isochrysis_galbana.AAC.11